MSSRRHEDDRAPLEVNSHFISIRRRVEFSERLTPPVALPACERWGTPPEPQLGDRGRDFNPLRITDVMPATRLACASLLTNPPEEAGQVRNGILALL